MGDRFVLTNPGGLFGVTLDRLGHEQLTSARNLALVRLCQYVELDVERDDGRVVEALASDIPEVLPTVREAGLPEPAFFDRGLRFTAVLFRPTVRTISEPKVNRKDSRLRSLSEAERRVLGAIQTGGSTAAELAEQLGRSTSAIHKTLTRLRAKGEVAIEGGRGTAGTRYLRW